MIENDPAAINAGRARYDRSVKSAIVRWMNADTGEIKERSRCGVDYDEFQGETVEYEWEQTPLELALERSPKAATRSRRA